MFGRRKKYLFYFAYVILVGLKKQKIKQQDLDQGIFYLYYGPKRDELINGKLIKEADWVFGYRPGIAKENASAMLVASILKAESENRLRWPGRQSNHREELNELLKENGYPPIIVPDEKLESKSTWYNFKTLKQGAKKIGLKLF